MPEFEALFLPVGGGWMPTEASLGPWGADLLHGGAVSALAIMLMEDEADDDYEAVRYSADFIRALPMARLDAAVHTVRKGQRLEVLDCELIVLVASAQHASSLATGQRPSTGVEP